MSSILQDPVFFLTSVLGRSKMFELYRRIDDQVDGRWYFVGQQKKSDIIYVFQFDYNDRVLLVYSIGGERNTLDFSLIEKLEQSSEMKCYLTVYPKGRDKDKPWFVAHVFAIPDDGIMTDQVLFEAVGNTQERFSFVERLSRFKPEV